MRLDQTVNLFLASSPWNSASWTGLKVCLAPEIPAGGKCGWNCGTVAMLSSLFVFLSLPVCSSRAICRSLSCLLHKQF